MNPFTLIPALRALIDPAKWKQRQININQLIVVLTFAAGFLRGTKYEVSDALIASVSSTLLLVVNWALTVLTTDKVTVLGRPAVEAISSTGDSPSRSVGSVEGETGDARMRTDPPPFGPTSTNMP